MIVKLLIFLFLLSSLHSDEGSKGDIPEFIFPTWKKMYLLNKNLLESQDHRAFVDIYLNDLAKEPYILEKEIFPVGSIVVKPIYKKQSRETISRIMIMMKMKDGYDKINKNWWYGIYDKNGMKAYEQGKILSCIRCHEMAEDTDFMFSESVMHQIVSQPLLKKQNTLRNNLK